MTWDIWEFQYSLTKTWQWLIKKNKKDKETASRLTHNHKLHLLFPACSWDPTRKGKSVRGVVPHTSTAAQKVRRQASFPRAFYSTADCREILVLPSTRTRDKLWVRESSSAREECSTHFLTMILPQSLPGNSYCWSLCKDSSCIFTVLKESSFQIKVLYSISAQPWIEVLLTWLLLFKIREILKQLIIEPKPPKFT